MTIALNGFSETRERGPAVKGIEALKPFFYARAFVEHLQAVDQILQTLAKMVPERYKDLADRFRKRFKSANVVRNAGAHGAERIKKYEGCYVAESLAGEVFSYWYEGGDEDSAAVEISSGTLIAVSEFVQEALRLGPWKDPRCWS